MKRTLREFILNQKHERGRRKRKEEIIKYILHAWHGILIKQLPSTGGNDSCGEHGMTNCVVHLKLM